jgi:hypothetical protein
MTTAGINSARSYAWSGLWNFVDRKVEAVFTELFRLNSDSIMALLVLLVRRSLDPDQSDWSKSRLIAFRTGASGQNEVLGNEC